MFSIKIDTGWVFIQSNQKDILLCNLLQIFSKIKYILRGTNAFYGVPSDFEYMQLHCPMQNDYMRKHQILPAIQIYFL